MKPKLKAPGSKRLKIGHEKLLSDFAFNLNSRHYTLGAPPHNPLALDTAPPAGAHTRPLFSST